jgi:gluconolactonase
MRTDKPHNSLSDPWGLSRDWRESDPAIYPEPAWQLLDRRFDGCLPHAPLRRLWTGAVWTEGPVWIGDMACLLFSDIPRNRVLRWCADDGRVSVFDANSNNSNGQTRDRSGHVIRCENASRAVVRLEHDGRRRVLISHVAGKRLNSPNDVIVADDGAIWFSDPTYGISGDYEGNRAIAELPTRVYRLDPESGTVKVMVEDVVQPNGLCFSPDSRTFYLADSGGDSDYLLADGSIEPRNGCSPGPRAIFAFDVGPEGALSNRRRFADLTPAVPDGLRCDSLGRVWTAACWGGAANNGVRVYAPDGGLLAVLHVPEVPSNIEFGGAKRTTLFITASRSLYAVTVNATGARVP